MPIRPAISRPVVADQPDAQAIQNARTRSRTVAAAGHAVQKKDWRAVGSSHAIHGEAATVGGLYLLHHPSPPGPPPYRIYRQTIVERSRPTRAPIAAPPTAVLCRAALALRVNQQRPAGQGAIFTAITIAERHAAIARSLLRHFSFYQPRPTSHIECATGLGVRGHPEYSALVVQIARSACFWPSTFGVSSGCAKWSESIADSYPSDRAQLACSGGWPGSPAARPPGRPAGRRGGVPTARRGGGAAGRAGGFDGRGRVPVTWCFCLSW